MFGLLRNKTAHHIGAGGILLRSCWPCMFVYAAICGAIFIDLSIFNVASALGSNLSHQHSRNVLSTPARIALKMVFEYAYSLFGHILSVYVWQDFLIFYSVPLYCLEELVQCFIVEY